MKYSIKQGFKNIRRHKGHTIASICTMTACIGLFCLAFMIIANISHMVKTAEESVGVTVFFDEGTSQARIDEIRAEVEGTGLVIPEQTVFTTAEEAWATVQQTYFADSPELAEGFAGDNPVADSASLEFHLKDLENQQQLVDILQQTNNVRRVNYSQLTASSLLTVSRVILIIAAVVILVLLVVSIFLISNTIAMSISGRREEIHIMRYMGATKRFVRRPFTFEGLFIGVLGAIIPLVIVFVLYIMAEGYAAEKLASISGLFTMMGHRTVFAVMGPVAAIMGIGIGLIGSGLSVKRYIKV